MTSPIPLSLARRSVVHASGVEPADVPLQGAATWDPRNGLRTWEALDVAARHVVSNVPHARIIAVGEAVGGLSVDEERALLDTARLALTTPPTRSAP